MHGWPVLTPRAVWLLALGFVPALLSAWWPPLTLVAWGFDLSVLALAIIDWVRSPERSALRATRQVASTLSVGVPAPVTITLVSSRALRGTLSDWAPAHAAMRDAQRDFEFTEAGVLTLEWLLTPALRGELTLGDLSVRLLGPWGLVSRQVRLAMGQIVKVYPDLRALTQDALALASVHDATARRLVKVRGEGREFDSLREFRVGDDRRTIDWKATARRSKTMVRNHRPERNQQVLLLLDCGRHMAGEVAGRRKLDYAVNAALRIARVSVEVGDQVGVIAFGATVKTHVPMRRGTAQLTSIARALSPVEASLEESDYGQAIDLAFARAARRTLVVIITDLLDADSATALVKRTRRLVPRHLPLIASLFDAEVHHLALAVPESNEQAYERLVASKLEASALATVAALREAGALVVRESTEAFGQASVRAYLDIKQRGLL